MILQDADLFTSLDVKDLGGAVAASCNIFAVVAEPHAADHTLVGERVHQVDIEHALNGRVEDGVPVAAVLLVVRRNRLDLEVAKRIANAASATHARIRSRMADLRRSIGGIRRGSVDLRGGRADGRAADTSTARTGRRCARRTLRTHAIGTLRITTIGRLLGVGVRRTRHGGRTLGHLVLRTHLLFLWRSVRLGRSEALLVAAGHDATKQTITWGD